MKQMPFRKERGRGRKLVPYTCINGKLCSSNTVVLVVVGEKKVQNDELQVRMGIS